MTDYSKKGVAGMTIMSMIEIFERGLLTLFEAIIVVSFPLSIEILLALMVEATFVRLDWSFVTL
jgi:hypothetical protein